MKKMLVVLLILVGASWGLLWYQNVKHIANQILGVETSAFLKNVSIESSKVNSWTDHYEAHLLNIEANFIEAILSGRDYSQSVCSEYVTKEHWFKSLSEKRPFEVTSCYSHGDAWQKGGHVWLYVNQKKDKAVVEYSCC